MNPSHPTPYPELNTVLLELVGGIQTILGEALIDAYLQGSFAAGDFESTLEFICYALDAARQLANRHAPG